LFLLSAEKIAGKFKWYFPNVLGVLADGRPGPDGSNPPLAYATSRCIALP
jgi:hypothetical protein